MVNNWIWRTILTAINAMTRLSKVWGGSLMIKKKLKIRLVNTLVFFTFLYGVESWSFWISWKRWDTFEVSCWRRMSRLRLASIIAYYYISVPGCQQYTSNESYSFLVILSAETNIDWIMMTEDKYGEKELRMIFRKKRSMVHEKKADIRKCSFYDKCAILNHEIAAKERQEHQEIQIC